MTDRTHPTDKETPMSKTDRHDELAALLSKISEESVTTSNVLADVLDLLRERLPERTEVKVAPFDPDLAARNLDALKHAVSKPMSEHGECCEPAPADDLPGEPVEPGDLRAGDRVEFTLMGERIACTLVSSSLGDLLYSDAPLSSGLLPNVVESGEWRDGISDVRLIERAPREDGDPDEALARVIFGDAFGSHEGLRLAQLDVARAAREFIEAEADDADFSAADLYYARATKAETERDEWRGIAARYAGGRDKWQAKWRESDEAREKAERALVNATQRVLDLTAERDKWNTLAHEADRNAKRHHDRAEKAEAERDEWKARHEALREDVETRWAFVDDNFLKDILHSILKGDDERAKGEQR